MRLEKGIAKAPAGTLAAGTAALAALVLLPLYMINGYVDLITGKFALLLVLAFAACLAAPMRAEHTPLKKREKLALLPLPILCADYLLALGMAEHKAAAFWGITGRNNGLLLLLACTALYFVVREHARDLPGDWLQSVLAGVGCVTVLVSLCNFFMLDPLSAYYTFLPNKGELFLGTLGNLNFFGAFLCLCVPIAAHKLMQAEAKRPAAFWGTVLVWLWLGLIVAGSDAAWLGALAGILLLCCRKTTGGAQTARLLAAGAIWAALAAVMGQAANLLPTRTELRTVSAWVTQPLSAVCMAAVLAVGAALLRRKPKIAVWKAARGAAAAAIVCAVLAFGAANLTQLPLGGLENVLRFGDSWGSFRGFVWSRLWQIWRDDLTWPQRLFGLGGDAVYYRLQIDNFADYARLLNGAAFDSAHSEYLQHLLCGGLVGLAAWLAFLAVSIRQAVRNTPALAGAIAAYAVQAAFSISMPGVLPLVFVLAALSGGKGRAVQGLKWQCAAALAACAMPLCWAAELLAGKIT